MARDFSDGDGGRLRSPFLFFEGTFRRSRAAVCPTAYPGCRSAAVSRNEPAGLGILPHPARYSLGDPDQIRATNRLTSSLKGGKTRIVDDCYSQTPPWADEAWRHGSGNPRTRSRGPRRRQG